MKPIFLLTVTLFFINPFYCFSQSEKPKIKFDVLKMETDVSLRGLCVVDDSTVWASGSKATVIRTNDAGKTWKITTIPEAKKTEFRDIEAFDDQKAFILGAGSPAFVYKSEDGNQTWRQNYRNTHPKIFFDAFAFWDKSAGIGFSDPIDQKLIIIRQYVGGRRLWQEKTIDSPKMFKNEAGFAASGTCLSVSGDNHVWIGLGGKPEKDESKFARVIFSGDRGISWDVAETTMRRSESAGVFSLLFVSDKYGIAVGGDYKNPEDATSNISLTEDGGKTWRKPKGQVPSGFRSCIARTDIKGVGNVLIATGTNGTDISLDNGDHWHRASMLGFHAIAFSKDKPLRGWATGANGRVARFEVKLPK